MNNMFETIKDSVSGELIVKKSKFICNMRRVSSAEEASEFIEEIKKKNFDARHNCSAYIINSNEMIARSSDDGEPSGTAGKPMLDVIMGSGLRNVCVVVTRYFGGVLLGTGGLVRAYSDVVRETILKAARIKCVNCSEIEIKCSYNIFPKIQNYIYNESNKVVDTIYGDNVVCRFMVLSSLANNIVKELVDLTSGNIEISLGKESWQLVP